MSLIESIARIKLPIEACAPHFAEKIAMFAKLLDLMDEHEGWLPYPDFALEYLSAVGAKHWADLYFRDGIKKHLEDNKEQVKEFFQSISDVVGPNPSLEVANQFLCALFATPDDPNESPFAQFDIENSDVESLTPEERKAQCDFWLTYHVSFFDDLALATHGESIYSLVHKAIEQKDDDALVKSVQIDRSLLPYFKDRLWSRTMKGDGNFFDSLAYRVNNPPRRGTNKHPLLWVFFKDLYNVGCLRRSITSKQILDEYQKAIPDHPKYSIDDELTVQRQRRKFMKLYRQPK